MLPKFDLTDANVLIIDENVHTRHQTMEALKGIGFRAITDTGKIILAPEFLAAQEIQLIVASVHEIDDGVLDLVRGIRQRKTGPDPFVPIILNAWTPDEDLVKAVLTSGADDLVIWPFSIDQLGQRIVALVQMRKNFIVADKYFGPDRRKVSRYNTENRGIKVPNGLRATALDDESALPSPEAVEAAFSSIMEDKVEYEALALHAQSKKIALSLVSGNHKAVRRNVAEMLRGIREMRDTIQKQNLDHLSDLAGAVEKILLSLGSNTRAAGDQKHILLEKTAQALSVASSMGSSVSSAASGISDEIQKVARLEG